MNNETAVIKSTGYSDVTQMRDIVTDTVTDNMLSKKRKKEKQLNKKKGKGVGRGIETYFSLPEILVIGQRQVSLCL